MYDLESSRKEKDVFFQFDHNSPFSQDEREVFQGLNYYPENPELRFEIEIEPFQDPQQVLMQTSTGDLKEYLKYGSFQFTVEGQLAELIVYTQGEGEAFVPFADATSGRETYGAGRYLELEQLSGKKYQVDFNLAYNPWCAYSSQYSCPIPPSENRLTVPIRAGEKDYSIT